MRRSCLPPGLPAFLLLFGLCVSARLAAGEPSKKMLVLLQDPDHQEEFSGFFGGLSQQIPGLSIEFKGARDTSLKLREYDQWLYDHLAIFAPKAEGKRSCINRFTCLHALPCLDVPMFKLMLPLIAA